MDARMLGRVMGRLTAADCVVSGARRDRAALAGRLWTIVGLGAFQGEVGWWMGVGPSAVEVSQYAWPDLTSPA